MRRANVGVLLGLFLFFPLVGRSQCATPLHPSLSTTTVSRIYLIPTNAPSGVLINAMSIWVQGCPGYAYAWPELLEASSANHGDTAINVTVMFNSGRSQGACARAGVDILNGAIIGGTVNLWEQESGGADCTTTYTELLAHEIGHLLGLGDVDTNASCNGTIMGRYPQTPTPEQCNLAASTYDTETALDRERIDQCSVICWTMCDANGCPQPPSWQSDGTCCSPILVDLNRNKFKLTGIGDLVQFDIDADGDRDSITWTSRGEADAFLCLDRDGDGRITSGAELFGNHTRLLTGNKAPNGYEALREFDTVLAGGNNDGEISAADAIWSVLTLWVDSNHNGETDSGELYSMNAAGIAAFDIRYHRNGFVDANGNIFRFMGRAFSFRSGGQRLPMITYDVFFLRP